MQRANTSDYPPPPSLARVHDDGGYAYAGHPPAGGLPPPLPAHRNFPTIPELFSALRRRWVLGGFVGMLVGLGAAASVWLAMPSGKHQVQALVQVKPPSGPIVGRGAMGEADFDAYKKDQMQLIKTRLLMNTVVSKPKVAQLPLIQKAEDPARFVLDNMSLSWPSPSLLAITMTGDAPDQMKVIIDAVVKAYIDDAEQSNRKGMSKTKEQLQSTIADLKKRLDDIDRESKRILDAGGATDGVMNGALAQTYATERTNAVAAVGQTKRELQVLEGTLLAKSNELKQIDSLPVNTADLERALDLDRKVRELKDKLAAADEGIKSLALKVPAGSPILKAEETARQTVADELAVLRAALKPDIEARLRAARRVELATDVKTLAEQQRRLELLLKANEDHQNKIELTIRDLKFTSAGANKGEENKRPLLNQKETLETELLNLELTEKGGSRVEQKDDPVVMPNQNLKTKLLMSTVAGAAGLGCVLFAVAYLEWRTRRVDSVEQVVSELGLRVIGTIPAFPSRASLRAADAAASQNWRFILSESVNSTRTMLLHTAKTQSMQVMMVTSAMQGEAKTSLSSQLATSMASAGLRTLLLDADMRNPSLHKLFDAQLQPGCAEILCQEIDVSDAVQPTTVPNLWLIPAGQCSHRTVAALAQGHPLETLFNRLRGQFDIIVVDSCPVLPVADALLVGQHVDGVVVSILQDVSQLPKVVSAAERLSALGIPILGSVVSGVKTDVSTYGYNYVKQLPA